MKSAAARLLDLLAGWAAFIEADEEIRVADAALSADEVADLYQLAGNECAAWEHLNEEEQARAVTAFVAEGVVPLLVRRENVPHSRTRAA